MDELKACPCEECAIRKYIACAFDVHIWGEDCPLKCAEFEKWRADNG